MKIKQKFFKKMQKKKNILVILTKWDWNLSIERGKLI